MRTIVLSQIYEAVYEEIRQTTKDQRSRLESRIAMFETKLGNQLSEVVFLEEFACDEQLVKGREGYSLVTLRASLHDLSTAEDLFADVFAGLLPIC